MINSVLSGRSGVDERSTKPTRPVDATPTVFRRLGSGNVGDTPVRPIRVRRIDGKFVPSTTDDPSRVTTYPVGRQDTTLGNGTIAYNWPAGVVEAAIKRRLKGERSIPFWPQGKFIETGGVFHDGQSDLWFIEVRPLGTPGPFEDYLEITQDEAAAWLESHLYELPEPLVTSLRREDGIFWVISRANADRPVESKPVWDCHHYQLTYRGVICLRGSRKASEQDKILEAFTAAQWSESIPSPFTLEKKTRDTVEHLNDRLSDNSTLRFRIGPGAKVIKWEVVDIISNPVS
jgi:hypothetical protein